ncbi:carbon-nitrogen hydrolase family protein [Salinispirillum sp. LH 10-3-1]|uniref:Carbon-nitrogen hydrolase family protein n=1 Tax=Salinispirillum sp. LH 10-3-1 TaxID=2952525 RepID=A0AB38YCK3_9GAMM
MNSLDQNSDPSSNSQLRVAGVQMTSQLDFTGNLDAAAAGIAQAAKAGASLVVLPENFATLGTGKTADIAAQEQGGDGPVSHWAAEQANKHQVWLVAGTVPTLDPETGKFFARSKVFSPGGHVIAQYDKIHLFDASVGDAQGRYAESDHYVPGTEVVTWTLGDFTIGMSVCYDLRFPELFHQLRQSGSDVIVVPSAFTHRTGQAHWQLLLRARAVEQGVYMLGVNQCGWHDARRQTWGHSHLVDPWGECVESLASVPAVMVRDVFKRRLEHIRAQLPTYEHHRLV